MKKLLFSLALAAAGFSAAAQTAALVANAATPAAPVGYAEQLGAIITQVLNTGDAATLQALAAKLERAAAVAPTDWLPRYYQAYALVISVLTGKEAGAAKDKALDQAEAALAQAQRQHGDESELLALRGLLYQARLGIEPRLRGQEYSAKAREAAAQAQALNPANPRPYLIEANNVYYTPAAFGGGAAAAKPLYEAAAARFAAFRPASPLAPSWGQDQVQARLKAYATAAPTATATH